METENKEQVAVMRKALNQYNMLQVRLDTTPIIEQIKMYLNAEIEIITQDDNGNFNRKVEKIGIPKANKRGIASILSWTQNTINPHVVQGNFPMDRSGVSKMYNQFIYEFQINLMDMIMINLYNYDIEEDESQGIVDGIMNLVIPFMTRLIGNKERESYSETFKEISSYSDTRKKPALTK